MGFIQMGFTTAKHQWRRALKENNRVQCPNESAFFSFHSSTNLFLSHLCQTNLISLPILIEILVNALFSAFLFQNQY